MSRRKTRVTCMSRRKARSGTRKQKGGFFGFLSGLFGNKPATNTGATGAATGAATATGAAATEAAPTKPATAPSTGWFGFGGGKTRHRRRRHHK